MFVMEYIKIKHPKTHQEASRLYEFIYALYPSKRDLTKTVEFKKSTENGIVRNMLLEAIDFRRNTNLHPRLEIPLITPPTTTTTTISTQEKSPQVYETPEIPIINTTPSPPPTTTQEITSQSGEPQENLFEFDATDQQIQALFDELRQDPLLESVFDDFQLMETVVETDPEKSTEIPEFSSEIDRIIQEECKDIEDLPDIHDTF